MPLRHSHARFSMGPRLREDDKKKTKETSRQERFGRELSALLSPESLPHDRHEQCQISYYYRATLTITVILANAGTHSPASAESFVSKSPHSGKHLQTKRQRPPMPSFSRTREPIRPRTPSASLATVLTAASIFKRRDNTPSPSFSRTREPIRPRTPRVSLAKVLTTTNIYKRRDNVPHYRHSRERGNPFICVHREFR